MIGEWVSADPPVKDTRWVQILLHRTKIEHPKVFAMSMLEELLRVLSSIPIEPFKAFCGVSHYDDAICYICQIYTCCNQAVGEWEM